LNLTIPKKKNYYFSIQYWPIGSFNLMAIQRAFCEKKNFLVLFSVNHGESRSPLIAMLTFTCSSPTSVAQRTLVYTNQDLDNTVLCHPSVALLSHSCYVQISSGAYNLTEVSRRVADLDLNGLGCHRALSNTTG
jgi:hypothetical protein